MTAVPLMTGAGVPSALADTNDTNGNPNSAQVASADAKEPDTHVGPASATATEINRGQWYEIARYYSENTDTEIDGRHAFHSSSVYNGGYHFDGYVKDTADLSDPSYMQIAVEGYDWREYYNNGARYKYWDVVLYDPAQIYTDDARWRGAEQIDYWPDDFGGIRSYHGV